MTKQEFLRRLEEGLATVSPDERVAALQYYTEYFDDAGPEHEAEVIAEIGAPEQLAADIRAESGAPEPAPTTAASFGMGEAPHAPDPAPFVQAQPVDPVAYQQGQQAAQNMLRRTQFGPGTENAGYPGGQYGAPYGGQYGQPGQPTRPPAPQYGDGGLTTILRIAAIVMLVMLSPAIFGLLMAAVMLALVPWMLCVSFVGVGAMGMALAATLLPVAFGNGLVMLGVCMLLLGLGGLCGYLGVKVCGKGLRACFKGVGQLFRWVGGIGRKEAYNG